MNAVSEYGPFVGRILLALIFIVSGWGKLTDVPGTTAYIAAQGLPIPLVLAWATVVVELLGGLMLVFGFLTRFAALVLFLFVIVVTIVFHPWWADASQQINFLKNLCIMGGMLYIMAFGAGKLSVDERDSGQVVGAT